MARTIFYEAGNQSIIGKEAVAYVVLNRVDAGFANNICDVVAQSKMVEDRRICQFSYFCSSLKPPKGTNWIESMRIARKVLTDGFDSVIIESLGDAMYFHATYVKPVWAKKFKKMAQIDDHVFYSEE